MKLVRIDWIDSSADRNEWQHKEDIEPLKPVKCTTVGILVDNRKGHKTVAHSMTKHQICGRITIPAVCIKRMRVLEDNP